MTVSDATNVRSAPTKREMLNELFKRFPNSFSKNPDLIRPLKIGIDEDIVALVPEFSEDSVRRALHAYTSTHVYMKSYFRVENGWRVDLEGRNVQPLLAHDYRFARVRLNTNAVQRLVRNLSSGGQSDAELTRDIQELRSRRSALRRELKTVRLRGKFGELVHISRVIYRATEALAAIDPTEREQLRRTQYFLFVTEAVRSLAAGDFSTSKEQFTQALKSP